MLLLSYFWLVATATVSLGVVLTHVPLLAKFVSHLMMYGRIRSLGGLTSNSDSSLMVPKKWFIHFYLAGVLCTTTTLCLVIKTFVWTGEWPAVLKVIFSFIGQSKTNDIMEPLPILLALIMEEIQVSRRFYECVFVNSYSDSKMSFVIYLTGMVFYLLIGLTVLTASPEGLINTESLILRWYHVAAIVLFIWSTYKQYKANYIIAKLRQDKSGNVVDKKHHIPNGDLFEYISCPHFFLEILIYTAVNMLFLWQHEACFYLWIFVAVNQMIMGQYGHTWYKNTFPKYPKDRKAIIPFIF